MAACDLIPGKAEKFLKEYNVEAPTFEDHKKMIDTVPMDAVSVCVYNRNHAECTIYALEHGVNVLLEKPMCVTAGRGGRNHAAPRRRAARSLSIGFQPRLDENMKMIKKIVESGALGEMYYIQTGGGRRRGIPQLVHLHREEDRRHRRSGRYRLLFAGHGAERHRLSQAPDRYRLHQSDFVGKTPEAYAAVRQARVTPSSFSVDDFAAAFIRLEGDVILDFRIAWAMHMDTPGDTIILRHQGRACASPPPSAGTARFDKPDDPVPRRGRQLPWRPPSR